MTSIRHGLPRRHALIRSAFVLLALLGACLAARAQALHTSAGLLKITSIDLHWRVNADASSVYEQTFEQEALSDQGAQQITKYTRMYNRTLAKLEVLEAYTLKQDGRRIPVGPDGIQTQSGLASAGTAPSWPDAEVIQITFPSVQKGDRTGWKIRQTQHTPLLPGWAALQEYLPPLVDYEKISARIEAPKSLGLQVFAKGLALRSSESGSMAVWEAQGQIKAQVMDDHPYDTLVSFPHLIASTAGSSEELSARFAEGFNAKAVPGDETRALAARITAGQATPRARAAAIHDWVRKNIRYVAVYLSTGGWVPHDVAWILKNGYGDCKDKALLEVALLRAADIQAVPVLINTSSQYVLPELAIGFDHCIVYIPSLDLFADPTDARIPFGALPLTDAGKPAAVALAGGARIMQTPVLTPDTNRLAVKTVLDIDTQGKATGSIEVQAQGMAATELQDMLAALPEGMNAMAVQKLLETNRWHGHGDAQYPPVRRDRQVQSLKIEGLVIDNLLNDPQGGPVNPQPRLPMPVYVVRHTGNYGAASRKYAVACTPIRVREEAELRFDPAYRLLRIPPDLQEIGPDGIAFEAHYERTGNTVKTTRELTLSQPRQSCTPEQYALRKPAMDRILKNLRSAILFEQ